MEDPRPLRLGSLLETNTLFVVCRSIEMERETLGSLIVDVPGT